MEFATVVYYAPVCGRCRRRGRAMPSREQAAERARRSDWVAVGGKWVCNRCLLAERAIARLERQGREWERELGYVLLGDD